MCVCIIHRRFIQIALLTDITTSALSRHQPSAPLSQVFRTGKLCACFFFFWGGGYLFFAWLENNCMGWRHWADGARGISLLPSTIIKMLSYWIDHTGGGIAALPLPASTSKRSLICLDHLKDGKIMVRRYTNATFVYKCAFIKMHLYINVLFIYTLYINAHYGFIILWSLLLWHNTAAPPFSLRAVSPLQSLTRVSFCRVI